MGLKASAVIVGAGPGGAAAALRLRQHGVEKVVLLDRGHFPRAKTCGSGLSPNAIALAETLGISDQLNECGYRVNSLRIVTPGGREMVLTTAQAALVVPRTQFDNLLVEKARTLGAEFHQGCHVTELISRGGRTIGVRTKEKKEYCADYVIMADGAHSVFSLDSRPKRTCSTLMGWWEDFAFEPGTMEMIFDANLSPLYGWMFPESSTRVNIGICIDGQGADGEKTVRKVNDVFTRFLEDHFRDRLVSARQIGRFKGHPISYTTWIRNLVGEGLIFIGESGRMTHNATGEGIYHAMQSGIYAADAIADIASGVKTEQRALRSYEWLCRRRFTFGFVMGHVLRTAVTTPLLDAVASVYNNSHVRRAVLSTLGSTLAGSFVSQQEEAESLERGHDGVSQTR